MTTLEVFTLIVVTSMVLACLESVPVRATRKTRKPQPRNRKGQWAKKALPLQIIRVQRPRFRRLDERTLVRV
jgi:hypothetical protein